MSRPAGAGGPADREAEVPDVELEVNGRSLPLAPFVRQVLAATVRGMVSVLKGGEDAREIRLTVRWRDEDRSR